MAVIGHLRPVALGVDGRLALAVVGIFRRRHRPGEAESTSRDGPEQLAGSVIHIAGDPVRRLNGRIGLKLEIWLSISSLATGNADGRCNPQVEQKLGTTVPLVVAIVGTGFDRQNRSPNAGDPLLLHRHGTGRVFSDSWEGGLNNTYRLLDSRKYHRSLVIL